MDKLSPIGIILILMLAIVGGFVTGLFSAYVYVIARELTTRWLALLCSVVFYVVPVWAILSLFKTDNLDVFYSLLLLSFGAGLYYFKRYRRRAGTDRDDSFSPPD